MLLSLLLHKISGEHYKNKNNHHLPMPCCRLESALCNPMGYIVHGILQAIILEWVAFPFSRIFPTQRSNPGLPRCRQILYQLSRKGSPRLQSRKCQGVPTHLNSLSPIDHSDEQLVWGPRDAPVVAPLPVALRGLACYSIILKMSWLSALLDQRISNGKGRL